ncbi:sulfite exporter TauE/SafE family protein [Pseudaminobacter sp. NGMCC 1.201702]|uniref:sulfite exporter TauE/SafE family protein n=1 Tax=Pseudaminobacter sp. NGMCC 1.201702 TaxID=3391825 RepID=UPI0039EE332C
MVALHDFGDWTTLQLAYLALSVAVAGFVRGYSGFGASLAAVPMLTVVLSPLDAIPITLMFEVALTLGLVHSSMALVQWSTVKQLVLGAVIGTPLGIYALSTIPAQHMRLGLSIILLGSVMLIWRKHEGMSWHLTTPATVGVGVISGLLSGGTAMSGPPVVMYFLASPMTPAVSRASMMVFFLCSASIAMVLGFGLGLYSRHTFVLAVSALPILFAGAALGSYFFKCSKPVAYRRVALMILTAIGIFAFANATLHYVG